MQKHLVFIYLIFLANLSFSQSVNAPLNDDYYHLIDRYEIKSGAFSNTFHSSVKPYQRKSIANFVDSLRNGSLPLSYTDYHNLEYFANDNWEWMDSIENKSKNPIFNTFYKVKSDFFHVNQDDFDLHINPVLYLSAGKEFDNEIIPYTNTRGIQVRGMIGKKLGFYSYLGENQAVYPSYVRTWIDQNNVVPHQGFWKNFKDNGVDFLEARGYISFDVINKYINLQFGHDKIFVGNGHRSLILSDFTNNYLFLKLNTKIWKLNYTNLFTEMKADAFGTANSPLATSDFPKKFVSFHHLSINIGKRLNLGLFESIIFGKPDSTGNAQYELSYLNPIIFYRAVEHQNGSLDNAILGADFKWIAAPGYMFYGQLVFDEFLLREIKSGDGWWANKYAYQLGAKKTDLLCVSNLDLQLETNWIRPFTYGHQTIFTNYAHYRQPLAHPVGANLREYLAILRYQPFNKLFLTGRIIYTNYGDDTPEQNWGNDVMSSYLTRELDYGNEMGQGVNTDLYLLNLRTSYHLKHNLFLDGNLLLRQEKVENNPNKNMPFISFALRWNFAPTNFDF